ncbi:MAG TPA: glycoside hydrolase family 97 N-terminal domain-containing protein, partial [Bacteroidales bacterium]|nr:glycoside hydrolase family 97 N-terminal domain-containing protein [Bacteroidales bacterium]
MKLIINYVTMLSLVIILQGCNSNKSFKLESPDGTIVFTICPSPSTDPDAIASFSLSTGNRKILEPSYLKLVTDIPWGSGEFRAIRSGYESVRSTWTNDFGERKEVPDNYNQLKIFMASGDFKMNLICRAYDEGAAFAWEIPGQQGPESVVINDENISFR